MKLLFILFCTLFTTTVLAQKGISKYTGTIDGKACILQYTTSSKKGKKGMEDDIRYKGFLKIGAQKITITGWYEGNTMRFEEVLKGKKEYTVYFDLSDVEEGYDLVGKRTINGTEQRILLRETGK